MHLKWSFTCSPLNHIIIYKLLYYLFEYLVLLGCCMAYVVSWLLMFGKMCGSHCQVWGSPFFLDCLTLDDRSCISSQTSIINHWPTPCNIPDRHRPQLCYGWSLKSCILLYLQVQMMHQHVTTNHKFRYKYSLSLLLSSVLQYHAVWYPPARQHGAIKWKTMISVFDVLNTSNTINRKSYITNP